MANPSEKNLTGTAPVFLVRDIIKATAYYRDILGFEFDKIWGCPPCFCMAGRDDITIMLSEAPARFELKPNSSADAEGQSWSAYIWVNDAGHLFKEFKSKGARIAYEPLIKEEYGMKEFAVRDLDGHVIAFGQDWPDTK